MKALYHYCSTDTFLSIISHRSIRLSSLSLSNDTMEGKLLSEIIYRLAEKDGLSESSINLLKEAIQFLQNLTVSLGFCLSEDGDLLSQWRGYASDAKGFSIGFSKEYFDSLSNFQKKEEISPVLNLRKVEYDATRQEEHIKPTYEKINKLINSGIPGIPSTLKGAIPIVLKSKEERDEEENEFIKNHKTILMEFLLFLPKLFTLKSPAFREEREWRLIVEMLINDSSFSYRTLEDRLIPYKEFELTALECEPIIDVFIGPKNLTPINIVENFLNQNGFNNVTVNRSAASYR